MIWNTYILLYMKNNLYLNTFPHWLASLTRTRQCVDLKSISLFTILVYCVVHKAIQSVEVIWDHFVFFSIISGHVRVSCVSWCHTLLKVPPDWRVRMDEEEWKWNMSSTVQSSESPLRWSNYCQKQVICLFFSIRYLTWNLFLT